MSARPRFGATGDTAELPVEGEGQSQSARLRLVLHADPSLALLLTQAGTALRRANKSRILFLGALIVTRHQGVIPFD